MKNKSKILFLIMLVLTISNANAKRINAVWQEKELKASIRATTPTTIVVRLLVA